MLIKQRNFWDNVNSELLEEFCRQKVLARFKKQRIKEQIKYN